jgi:hypothetical protein
VSNLTPAQLRVLEAAQRGDLSSMNFGSTYLEHVDGDYRNVTPVARRLEEQGLIENGEYHRGGGYDITPTAAGRAVLGIDAGEG